MNLKTKPTLQSYIVWLIASLFYTYVLIVRNLPVVTSLELQKIFTMSETFFGQVRGIYFIFYCIAHLPMIYLLDRFGEKKILPIAMLLCVIGILPMVWSVSPYALLIGRAILGLGSSAGVLGIFKVNRALFPENYFSRMLGISATIGLVGSFVSMNLFGSLFTAVGYYKGIYITACIPVILSLLALMFFPKTKLETKHGFFDEIFALITNKKFLFVSIIGGLMIGPMEGFIDGWSVPLLETLYGIKIKSAQNISSFLYFGFALGSPILAFAADFTGLHKKIFGICGLMMGVLIFSLLFLNINSTSYLLFCYLMIGFFSAYQVLCIDLAGKVVPGYLKNISGAGCNMIIMSFGYMFHTAIAVFMNGRGMTVGNRIIYNNLSIITGIIIVPILCIVGYLLCNWSTVIDKKVID